MDCIANEYCKAAPVTWFWAFHNNSGFPAFLESIILDAIKRVGNLPIVGAVTQTINFILRAGSDARKVSKAIQAKPSFKKSVKFLKDDFPTLAVALGIGSINTENGE